jgi:hypothetical protein
MPAKERGTGGVHLGNLDCRPGRRAGVGVAGALFTCMVVVRVVLEQTELKHLEAVCCS